MSFVLWVLAGLAALVVLVVGKVALDLANKEIQGWMYDLCFIVLHWSRKRLPPELRASLYDDELLEDELRTVLYHTYEKKPITALFKGLRFSIGCLTGARRHARAVGWRPASGRRRRFDPPANQVLLLAATAWMIVGFSSLTRDIHNDPGIPDWMRIIAICVLVVAIVLFALAIAIVSYKMTPSYRRRTQASGKALGAHPSGRHRAR